jgi:hypothetical protein
VVTTFNVPVGDAFQVAGIPVQGNGAVRGERGGMQFNAAIGVGVGTDLSLSMGSSGVKP